MKTTTNIAFLLDNSYLPDSRVENEINVLLKEGYSIDLYCVFHPELPKIEEHGNLKIYREISLNIHKPFSREYRQFVNTFVQKVSDLDYDVIHCHDFRMFFLGCEIKEIKPRTFLIYDSHEYLAGYPYYRRSKTWKAIIKGFFIWNYYYQKERRNISKADIIITVSTTLKDFLAEKSGKPCVLIRNMPPIVNLCQGERNYWREKFNLAPDSKVIIHTGSAQFSVKRRDFLLECIEEYPNLVLIFLGSNSTIDEMKKVVQRKGLNSIYFHENVKRSDITYYCSQADIGLVYTWNKQWKSYWYALPNKLMDVSLSGLPVLCTEQPELKRFVDIFRHGITFNGESKSSLKKAIDLLLENYDLLKSNAIKIENHINWQLEGQKLIDLYNRPTKL